MQLFRKSFVLTAWSADRCVVTDLCRCNAGGMGAAMHLNFSQCTNSSQQTQGASSSQRLSCALSGCRLGTPAPLSLQLSEEDPLRDATNMMEAPPLPCPQMYSQQNASQQLLRCGLGRARQIRIHPLQHPCTCR